MTWIREADISGVDDTAKAISINADAMQAVINMNRSIAFGSSALTRVQEEAIATVVSVANKCRY